MKALKRLKGVSALFLLLVGSFALLLVATPAKASAATYYIDYSAGSDVNNGTSKTTPWQHAPGMTGFSGRYTHQAGDHFIFKGGVAIH
jgi:hypothetical protein